MGDVLDNLFSILPIVLAILWVLRRASKKKAGAKAGAQTGAQAAESPTVSERLRRFEKKVAKAVQGESEGDTSSGEDELYEKIETRRVEAAPRSVQQVNTVERLVEDRSKEDEGRKYSGPEKSNSFERFRELSPLAQGMVWSIILEEPLALKEPKI